MEKNLKEIIKKTSKSFYSILPLMLGTILLISLMNILIPKEVYLKIFQDNLILDSIFGGIIGSFLAGNPIISYIMGGELLSQGISLVAVTAFLLAWVTVGLIQIPTEISSFGKKFAIIRNLVCLILSIIAAIVISLIIKTLGGII